MKQVNPYCECRKVLVSVNLVYASWRDFLSGILKYIESHVSWDIRIDDEPGDISASCIRTAERSGYAGMIVASNGKLDFDALSRTRIPIVFAGIRNTRLPKRKFGTSFVMNDNEGIGTAAARYYLEQGRFRSFVFVQSAERPAWSTRRCLAFRRELRKNGKTCRTFRMDSAQYLSDRLPDFGRLLESLPKPVAIMADCDRCAAKVLSACHDISLPVPEKAAVLGVDNDVFFCSRSTPPLSSVLPGHFDIGFTAAAELDRLMTEGARARNRTIRIPIREISERESTRDIPSWTVLSRRINDYIQNNFRHGITVAKIARELGISRRLAELRYRQSEGLSIREKITAMQLENAKRLLATTRESAASIARQCGFSCYGSLSHFFARREKTSLREWRKQNAVTRRRETPG